MLVLLSVVSIEDLKEFGKTYDFEVIEINAQQLEKVSVSSTKIRKALEEGNIETTNNACIFIFIGNLPVFTTNSIDSLPPPKTRPAKHNRQSHRSEPKSYRCSVEMHIPVVNYC